MSLGEKIRHGTKWLLAGNISGRVIEFIFGIVLARLLIPADFGLLVTVQIFTGIAGFISGGGMGQALVQAKNISSRDYQVVFTLQLLIGCFIYFLFYLISPWFSIWFNHEIYTDLMRVSALTFLLRPFMNICTSKLNREMRYKESAIIRFVSMLVSGVSSIIMAFYGMGVWSLVIGGIIGSILSIFILFVLTQQRPAFRFDKETTKRLGGYGIKVSANDIVSYINKQSSNFIISRLSGPGSVGLFNKSSSLQMIPMEVIGGSAYQTVFRALSSVQDNMDQSRYIFFRTITLITVYSWPFFIGLWWLAEPFISIVYGEKWIASAEPLRILSISGLILCIAMQCGAVTAAQDKLGQELVIHIQYGFLLIIACLIGIQWGISGVAWSLIPCHIFTTARMFRVASHSIGGKFSDLLDALKPAIMLNTILFATLAIVHWNSFPRLSDYHIAYYFSVMSIAGVLSYIIAFLFLPIPALRKEADRWKLKLRLKSQEIK